MFRLFSPLGRLFSGCFGRFRRCTRLFLVASVVFAGSCSQSRTTETTETTESCCFRSAPGRRRRRAFLAHAGRQSSVISCGRMSAVLRAYKLKWTQRAWLLYGLPRSCGHRARQSRIRHSTPLRSRLPQRLSALLARQPRWGAPQYSRGCFSACHRWCFGVAPG